MDASLLTYCRDKHDDETGEHRDAVSDSATERHHPKHYSRNSNSRKTASHFMKICLTN